MPWVIHADPLALRGGGPRGFAEDYPITKIAHRMSVVVPWPKTVNFEVTHDVSLGMRWEKFVNEKVESGRYQTASEVLCDGLRLLEQREQALRSISPRTKEELEEMLEVGIKQLNAGKGIPGDVALKDLRQRAAARRANRVTH